MTLSHALNAVDRLFRDVMGTHQSFGGKVLMMGGDFRQYLPVVRHGNQISRSDQLFRPEDEEQLNNRAIMCPKNYACFDINIEILKNNVPDEAKIYRSMDSIEAQDAEEIANFPVEFLNTIQV